MIDEMQMLLWVFALLAYGAAAFTPLYPNLDISLPGVGNEPCQREAALLHQGLTNQSLWAMRSKFLFNQAGNCLTIDLSVGCKRAGDDRCIIRQHLADGEF